MERPGNRGSNGIGLVGVKTETSEARKILEEAEALMNLESAATRVDPKLQDFSELYQVLDGRGYDSGTRFGMLGTALRRRIETLARIEGDAKYLFKFAFGVEPPEKLRVKRRPYSIQFETDRRGCEYVCSVLKLDGGYNSSDGLCFSPDNVSPKAHDSIGGTVTLVRAYTDVPLSARDHAKQEWWELNEITERHEEVHAFQNLMLGAGYMTFQSPLARSFLKEESATCISLSERRLASLHRPLLHSGLYFDHKVPYQDFDALASKITGGDESTAAELVDLRRKNAYAVSSIYNRVSIRRAKLVGWAFLLLDFQKAYHTLDAIPSR
ncbi:MAG: hypothetical protein HYT71_04260 [Candidatus Aenigmarchaeota archaeon]|nr:hypothetical protein [Candidatus Aenigmarchaeota archaeon]